MRQITVEEDEVIVRYTRDGDGWRVEVHEGDEWLEMAPIEPSELARRLADTAEDA